MSKRHLRILVLVLATLALGSILLAACARPGAPTASAAGPANGGTPAATSSSSSGPTVHLGPANFVQSSVTVPKGSMLTLVNDGQYTHIIQNGSWVNGAPKAAIEPGAPTVNNLQFNSSGQSQTIGPFNTAGTFHIYCTIHLNMNLTITVS